jgi:hypothetical protein
VLDDQGVAGAQSVAAEFTDYRLPWVVASYRPLTVPGPRHFRSQHDGSVQRANAWILIAVSAVALFRPLPCPAFGHYFD